MRTSHLIAIALAAVTIASTANADVVLIDWSSSATVANPAGDGKYWNTIGTTSATNLISSTNSATDWDVALTFSHATGVGFGGTGINGPAGGDPFDEPNAIVDGIFANSINRLATFTFSDLTPNATYDLSMIGGRAAGGEDGEIDVITGAGSGGALLNSGTVLNLSVTADAFGVIAFTFSEPAPESSPSGNSVTFNAMSISSTSSVVVPAPAALPMGLVLLGAAAARRSRNQ